MSSTLSASDSGESDNVPALVVTFGTTARKRRLLDKPTSLLGRGKGCDIRLDAVEISTVHCVITHTACGLAVRDCDSRAGTLVNDQPVKEGTLSHGDVLQIGPFSFRVHLPKGWPPTLPAIMRSSVPTETAVTGSQELGSNTPVNPEELAGVAERIFAVEERERAIDLEKAEIAKVRAELEEQKKQLNAERHADIDYVTSYKNEIESLQYSIREQAARLQEAAEAAERAQAEHEALMYPLQEQTQGVQARLDQAYAELDQLRSGVMQTQLDLPGSEIVDEVNQLRAQLAESLAANQRLAEQLAADVPSEGTQIEPIDASSAAAFLELSTEVEQIRSQLAETLAANQQLTEQLAAGVSSDRTQLEPIDASSAEAFQTLSLEVDQLRSRLSESEASGQRLRDQLAALEANANNASKFEVESVLEAELDQVRRELALVVGQNEQLHRQIADAGTSVVEPDLEGLRAKFAESQASCEQMRQRLEMEHNDHERRLAVLKEELERERMQVKQLVREAAQQYSSTQNELHDLREKAAASSGTIKSMQAGVPTEYVLKLEREVESLRAIAVDLEAQLATSPAHTAVPTDLADYENQLNEFRLQLEAAQSGLQQQEAEIQEKVRQNELQISRERAEIGRERVSLERIRQEVRTELEHAEREAKNFERMAGVHKLASEVRTGKAADESQDTSLSGRIRGFLKRMGDR